MKLYLFLFVLFTSMLYPSFVEARGHKGKSGHTKRYKSKKSYSFKFKKSFKKGYRAGSKIFRVKAHGKSRSASPYKAPKILSRPKPLQRPKASPRGSYSPYGPKTKSFGLGIKQPPVLLSQETPNVSIRNPNYNKHMLRIEALDLELSAVSVSQYMSWQEWFLFGTKEIERSLYDITY